MAIIVPDADVLEVWAKKNEMTGDIQKLCRDKVRSCGLPLITVLTLMLTLMLT